MLAQFNMMVLGLLAQAPVPHAANPPGADKLQTLLNWTKGAGLWFAVGATVIVAIKFFASHHRGTLGPETVGQLGSVLAGCVLLGVAPTIVNALVS